MSRETKTIVLIHGLWMTPRCWDNFRGFYAARGNHVLTPPWPRMQGDEEAIRRNPAALAGLGLREITDHYEAFIRTLDEPPILIGHSMGGLIVQLLLARKLGCAGVAIDSATPTGIFRLPWSEVRAGWPALGNPLNFSRTVTLTFEQFRYAFAHLMPVHEARAAYQEYAVPGPGRPIFEVALGNFNPWAPNRVNYREDERAPLLLIAGSDDHLVPAVLNKINAKLYRDSAALTDFRQFSSRSHLIIAQAGWQEVAEYALNWAQSAVALSNAGVVPTAWPASVLTSVP